jgi:ABC-type lipoprotein release transport system permease subunit
MTSRALAWRTMTAQPGRAGLAIAGVAVIGALLFDMLLLSHGLLLSYRALLESAGYDVRVVSVDNPIVRMPIPEATAVARAVERLPEVREVAILRRARAAVLAPGRKPADVTLLSVSPRADRLAWRIVAGDDLMVQQHLTDPPPLVINRKLAETLSLSPGSTVRVRLALADASALPAVAFRVAGIGENLFDTAADLTASTDADGFERARAGFGDEAEVLLVASRPEFGPTAAVAAIERLRPNLRAYSNEQIVAQINENGFAYFRQISFVLSSITLGFAFLLIATLLTVSVNQQLGQIAALRALGFPRSRIAATLLWESAVLVGVGGVLSIPIGWALASILDRILRDMPGISERVHFFVFEPGAIVVHLGLLAATGVAAAAYPVWIATSLPIAATLRLETIS